MTIEIIDIGSLDIDGPAPYRDLPDAIIHCFDPQETRADTDRLRIHREVIADGQPRTLYVCKAPGMTSLLQPDRVQLARFHCFEKFGTVVRRLEVKTRRLDSFDLAPNMLKLDCQGAESLVLTHASQTLDSVDVIHIEVSFHRLYFKQPLFDDIAYALTTEGFEPYKMVALKHWPTDLGLTILEADMVYIRRKPRNPTIMNEILQSCYGDHEWPKDAG